MGVRSWVSIFPLASTMPAATLVPPMSTPMTGPSWSVRCFMMGWPRGREVASSSGLGGEVPFFHVRGQLTQQRDEGGAGDRKRAIAAIGETQFAVELRVFQVNQLDSAGFDFVAGEGCADQRDSQIGGDETFDHADAGQFHAHVQFCVVRA